MSKRLRINDLAKLLNLSSSTVGAALSGRGGNTRVSAETRNRVQQAAQRLNYRVNASASAVRRQRFNNIGFFTAKKRPSAYSFADIISHGVSTAAKKHGQNVVLVRISELMEADLNLPRALAEACLDTLVIQDSWNITEVFQNVVESLGVPVTYVNEKRPANAAYSDDVLGGRMMTEYLISQGFKKIVMIAPGSTRSHYSYHDRTQGYQEAMTAAGLTPFSYMSAIDWREDICALLKSSARPEAIFCADDQTALSLQRILYHLRLRAPDDIAIAGCNGELLAEYSPVPLTTLRIDFHAMAQTAVDLAMTLYETGVPSVPSVVLQPELIVSESTRRMV